MSHPTAWLRIIRPPIVFISCFGAVVGALNAATYVQIDLSVFQIIMILLGAMLLSSGLMIHNDVTDLKSDEVNRPNKPIPKGSIKPETAGVVGLLLMILSIVVAFLINIENDSVLNWKCGLLTILVVAIGIYYNYFGKNHGILGNVAVAFGVGSIPLWGALGAFPDNVLLMMPLAFAIFIQEIGREIMVNAGDYQGDLRAGYKTLPVQVGRKKAMYIALFFYLWFIPIYPLPAFDWIGLGVPQVFGKMYLFGGAIFAASLLITWLLTYRVVVQNEKNEKNSGCTCSYVSSSKYTRNVRTAVFICYNITMSTYFKSFNSLWNKRVRLLTNSD